MLGSQTEDVALNTTSLLRHINARRCLRLLQNGRQLSRADMARQLGLTRATTGNAMRVLLDAGLVVESAEMSPESRKGRPGVGVSLNPSGAYFVGVDVGTRSLTGVLLDLQMNVVSRIVEPTGPRYRDAGHIAARLLSLIERLLNENPALQEKVEGIGISVPGLVGRDGSVVHAPFLEWRNYPLQSELTARSPADWSVMVCNDAFAFANAELAASATAKAGSMLVVLLAEGIGGAIIDDGRVVMGGHGYSGEIGHTIVSAAGRVDTFEMLAGAKLFTRLFEEGQPVADGVQMLLANVGDKAVDAVLDAWVSGLSAGLVNAIHLLDPGRIVLGGPLAGLYPKLSRRIQADIKRRLLAGFAMPEIRVAQFGADGAAIGAAATIRDTLFALPDLETNTL